MFLPVTYDMDGADHQERPECDFVRLYKTIEQARTHYDCSQASHDIELSLREKDVLLKNIYFLSSFALLRKSLTISARISVSPVARSKSAEVKWKV